VRVFDWGEVEPTGRLFMAMDLVKDAAELDLRTGTLIERIGRLVDAAKIVAAAHAVGVIHRDLKPANFLVATDGSIHLTDFGISKNLADPEDEAAKDPALGMGLTVTGMAMGTPYYMSPEQFEDAKSVDARGDVYALGVMLFLALAGRLPYTGDNASQVLSTQMKVRYEGRKAPRVIDHLPGVPPALDAVCSKAMALDPAQRYPSVEAFVAALERIDWRKALASTAPAGGAARASGKRIQVGGSASSNEPTMSEPPPGGDLRDAKTELDTTRTGADRLGGGAPKGPACAACGGAMQGEYCAKCGLHANDAAAMARKQSKRHEERAAATMSTAPAPPPAPLRPQREVGAGVSHEAGISIPNSVWFVIGILICVAVGVRLLPTPPAGKKDDPGRTGPPPNVASPNPTTATPPGPPHGKTVPLEDVLDQVRAEHDLAQLVHAAWRARAVAKPDEQRAEAEALDLPADKKSQLPISFGSDGISCTRTTDGSVVTEVVCVDRGIVLTFTNDLPAVARRTP
jgi:hypothetical protein